MQRRTGNLATKASDLQPSTRAQAQIAIRAPSERRTNEMVRLESALVSPEASRWLAAVKSANVMHVFAKALNLIDPNDRVLSVVTPSIGPGPFALVVFRPEIEMNGQIDFASLVNAESVVKVSGDRLEVGSVTIDTSGAEIWQPRPAWSVLSPDMLAPQVRGLWRLLQENAPSDSMAAMLVDRPSEAYHQIANNAWAELAKGLKEGDLKLCKRGARALAGLGPGLTPAGDDFLMGIIYAIHSSRDYDSSQYLIDAISGTAAPRTTRLSAAWLAAASRGEASSDWHTFVEALVAGNTAEVEAAALSILPTGHTSGADALAGFLAAVAILSKPFER